MKKITLLFIFTLISSVSFSQSSKLVTKGTNQDDLFEIEIDNNTVIITLNKTEVTRQKASTTRSLTINGGDGDDKLDINFGTSKIPFPITFNGEGQRTKNGDLLTLNGSVTNQTIRHTLPGVDGHNGTVFLDGTKISFTGLEPLTGANSVNTDFFLPVGASHIVTLENGIIQNTSILVSNSNTFEDTTFPNPTESLYIEGGDESDIITVETLDPDFDADLSIYSEHENSDIIFNSDINIGSGNYDIVTATIWASAELMTSDTGSITFSASHSIEIASGSTLLTDHGDINLTANPNALNATITNAGIRIEEAAITTTGTGNININGTANPLFTTSSDGVIISDSQIDTLETGNVSITGKRGIGADNNHSVSVVSESKISSNNGDISITGLSDAQTTTGIENYGVYIDTGRLLSSGSGSIYVEGEGGGGTDSNVGIFTGNGARIITKGGQLTLTGQGAGSGSENHGIAIEDGTIIEDSTEGAVTLIGTGGNGSQSNYGILVDNAEVRSGDGILSITGTGGDGTANDNSGVAIRNQALVKTSEIGNIQITGNGGLGSEESMGVDISDNGTLITSNGADIIILGEANIGNQGTSNIGVYLHSSADISAFTNGNIEMTGIGGGGTVGNTGVRINSIGSSISAINGIIVLRGTALLNPSDSNTGISIGSTISTASGSGDIIVVGFGSNSLSEGVLFSSANALINSGGPMTLEAGIGATVTPNGVPLSHLITTTQEVRIQGGVKPGFLENNLGLFPINSNTRFTTNTTLSLNLTNTNTPGVTYDQIAVSGETIVTDATLNLIPINLANIATGAFFTIINNDGTDPIIDTFDGLPEGEIIVLDGQYFKISYIGGDGNDVTITSTSDPVVVDITNTSQEEGNILTHTVTLDFESTIDEMYSFNITDNVTGGTDGTDDYDLPPTFSDNVTYNETTMMITVPAGVSEFTVSVQSVDDLIIENEEVYTITIDGEEGQGEITDNDNSAVLSVSTETENEGDNLVHNVTVTESDNAETYTYILSNDTTENEDYTTPQVFSNSVILNGNGTITVPANTTSFTVTVASFDDGITEENEIYNLIINGINASGTINDNDTITIESVSSDSQNEDTNLVHTVTLSGISDTAQNYTYSFVNITTDPLADYSVFPSFSDGVALISFGTELVVLVPAGVLSFTITIDVIDDSLIENDEEYNVTIETVTATGTIIDNDNAAVLSVSSEIENEGSNLVHNVTVTESDNAETYTYILSNNTTENEDYTTPQVFSNSVVLNGNGTITVPANTTSFNVTVASVQDLISEVNEIYNLNINGITATGTINDNDNAAVLSVSSETENEGDNLVHNVTVTESDNAETYTYILSNNTTENEDYTTPQVFSNSVVLNGNGTITVPANTTSFNVTVASVQDLISEVNEIYNLNINGITATGTIIDNDSPAVLSLSSETENEGDNLVHNVTVTESDNAETYTYLLTNDTTENEDYITPQIFSNSVVLNGNGTITVPANTTSFNVTVASVQDLISEANEIYNLNINGITATGTIIDNDNAVVLSVSSETENEGDNLVHNVTVTESDNAETYTYLLTNDTTENEDYITPQIFSNSVVLNGNGTITVPANTTSFNVTVVSFQDLISEENETYNLNINGITATGTITDNDSPAVLSVSSEIENEGDNLVHNVTVTDSDNAETYTYLLTNDTTENEDYTTPQIFSDSVVLNGNGTITVPANTTLFNVTVASEDDQIFESNESYNLTIGGVIATGTITNNDTIIIESITSDSQEEDTDLVHTVTVSGLSDSTQNYTYSFLNITTDPIADFSPFPSFSNGVSLISIGTETVVRVPAGVLTFTVTTNVIDDTLIEDDEVYDITIGTVTATGTIIDNDEVFSITCPEDQTGVVDNSCMFTLPDYTDLAVTTGFTGTVTQSPLPGTLVLLPQEITLTADDGTDSDSCTFIVKDSIAPTIDCPEDENVIADSSDLYTIPDYTALIIANDNCIILSYTQEPAQGTTIAVGETETITLTVSDGSSTTVCMFNITVLDNGLDIICPEDQMVEIGENCMFELEDYTSLATLIGADNNNITQDPLPGTLVMPNSTTTITLTYDNDPNTTCTFLVIVGEDNIPPTAICQDITIELGENGLVSITPDDIDNGSFDNCGDVLTFINTTAFNCEDIGENTVFLTVRDDNNNISICSAIVTVVDNLAPIALCQNITIDLDENEQAVITANDINNGSTDNCEIADISIDITTFGCDNAGENEVILTIEDTSGNISTCTAIVTVNDTISPTAICQNLTVSLDQNGLATITADEVNNGSFDNCGEITTTIDIDSFDCTQLGDNNVTLTVTDANGNTDTCIAIVTVNNALSTTAICQDITINLDQNGLATITADDVDGGSFNNCGNITTSINVNSFDCTSVGDNIVILTVTDDNNNTFTCESTVTVNDITPPTALCQNILITLDQNGLATIEAMDIDNGSFDACGISETIIDITNFDCSNIGDNIVTLIVTDTNGNTASCQATVTVLNATETPTAICENIIISLDTDGMAYITPDDINDGITSNNCSTSVSIDIDTFDCDDLGQNEVTLTVVNESGETSTCVALVTVVDVQGPNIVCLDSTIAIGITEPYELPDLVAEGLINVTDNCTSELTTVQTPPVGTLLKGGETEIEVVITDNGGNTSTCNFTIIVDKSTDNCKDELNTLSVYPIPASSRVILDNPFIYKLDAAKLIDMTGRIVKEFDVSERIVKSSLDISEMAVGSYYLVIEARNCIKSLKILKD